MNEMQVENWVADLRKWEASGRIDFSDLNATMNEFLITDAEELNHLVLLLVAVREELRAREDAKGGDDNA